jgi:hypothetical protein
MNSAVRQQVQLLIDRYFVGQNNNELVIKNDTMNDFLREFSEVVISRTIDVAFGIKE